MREKLKAFGKAVENFWYHHKIVTCVILFYVIAGLYLGIDALKKSEPDMVITYVGEAYGDESQFARAESVLLPLVGDLNGDGKEKINYRMLTVRPGTVAAAYDFVSKEQGFNYSFIDQNVRLYFIEERFLKEKEVYFEPLEGILSPESLAGAYKNADGESIGVPLSDNALAKKMDFAREGMYLAVKRVLDVERPDDLVRKQHEKAKEVLQYIIEGNE